MHKLRYHENGNFQKKRNHLPPDYLNKWVVFHLSFQAYHFDSALVIKQVLFSIVLCHMKLYHKHFPWCDFIVTFSFFFQNEDNLIVFFLIVKMLYALFFFFFLNNAGSTKKYEEECNSSHFPSHSLRLAFWWTSIQTNLHAFINLLTSSFFYVNMNTI